MTLILPASSPMHFTPRPFGRLGTRFLLDHPRGMLVADPGLGKTSMGLSALDMLKIGGSSFFPALVMAPKRVADVVWTGERDKWDAFQDLAIVKVMGEEDVRREVLRKAVADIYVINYDLAPWLVSLFPAERWPFKIVLADESQRLKGFRLSKGRVRASALSMIARYTGRWWNLTGTPTPNGLHDLWGQYWFVDFGETLKRTYDAYFEAYFMQNQYTRKISPQRGSEAEIAELVKGKLMALRAVDWLPLEKPQEIPVEFNMPPETMTQYRAMEKDFFLTLTDAQIAAGTAAVKSIKLLQIASGSVYDENTMPHHLHDGKLEALEDILEQIYPQPLLVATHWRFDNPRILKHFPDARVYTGQKDLDDWNAGKIRIMLLPFQSPHGLNLAQVCNDVCFYSYNWSGENWQQMIERVGPVRQYQLGFKKIVRVWSIRARGTIEADVVESNEGKISVEQAFKRARARRQYE